MAAAGQRCLSAAESVALTLTVGLPELPASAVPLPLARVVSTKYSAAVTLLLPLAASLTCALNATLTVPFVRLGVSVIAPVSGPCVSGPAAPGAMLRKVSMPPRPAVLLLCSARLPSYTGYLLPAAAAGGTAAMASRASGRAQWSRQRWCVNRPGGCRPWRRPFDSDPAPSSSGAAGVDIPQQHLVTGHRCEAGGVRVDLAVDQPVLGLVVAHVKGSRAPVERRVDLAADQDGLFVIGRIGMVRLVCRGRPYEIAAPYSPIATWCWALGSSAAS